MKENRSSKVIFGNYTKELKELEENGWKVQNLVKELGMNN